jgi:hypothetical protein
MLHCYINVHIPAFERGLDRTYLPFFTPLHTLSHNFLLAFPFLLPFTTVTMSMITSPHQASGFRLTPFSLGDHEHLLERIFEDSYSVDNINPYVFAEAVREVNQMIAMSIQANVKKPSSRALKHNNHSNGLATFDASYWDDIHDIDRFMNGDDFEDEVIHTQPMFRGPSAHSHVNHSHEYAGFDAEYWSDMHDIDTFMNTNEFGMDGDDSQVPELIQDIESMTPMPVSTMAKDNDVFDTEYWADMQDIHIFMNTDNFEVAPVIITPPSSRPLLDMSVIRFYDLSPTGLDLHPCQAKGKLGTTNEQSRDTALH